MQVHRKILAHGAITGTLQFRRRRPHDHPIAFPDRAAQQFIPDCATHKVHLHSRMLTERGARSTCSRARALLLMSSLSLSGCSAGYLLQAAQGQCRRWRAGQPIQRVIASEATDAALRTRLQLVSAARDFASRELSLPDNASYRSYSALHRPYAVWNVVATPEFSVEPRRWCFPITGCISYRGYFRDAGGPPLAAALAAPGEDPLLAAVSSDP